MYWKRPGVLEETWLEETIFLPGMGYPVLAHPDKPNKHLRVKSVCDPENQSLVSKEEDAYDDEFLGHCLLELTTLTHNALLFQSSNILWSNTF